MVIDQDMFGEPDHQKFEQVEQHLLRVALLVTTRKRILGHFLDKCQMALAVGGQFSGGEVGLAEQGFFETEVAMGITEQLLEQHLEAALRFRDRNGLCQGIHQFDQLLMLLVYLLMARLKPLVPEEDAKGGLVSTRRCSLYVLGLTYT